MTWDLINSLGRVLLVVIAVYKVYQFRDHMITAERAGLCIMASGCLLTVPVIWQRDGSPFEGWAAGLLSYGALIFIAGRTWRDRRHQRANDQQVKFSQAWMKGRTK